MRIVPQFRAVLLLAGLMTAIAWAAGLAQAEEIDHAAEYEDCLLLAEVEPEEAFESASAWQAMGGGEPAQHCAAVALIELGHYVEAGQRLEALANRLNRKG